MARAHQRITLDPKVLVGKPACLGYARDVLGASTLSTEIASSLRSSQ
jgi:hypothetical protein